MVTGPWNISRGLMAILFVGLTLVSLNGKALGSPIAENWVYATVWVENEWGKTGTGFLVFRQTLEDVNTQEGKIFLVTNKHVIHEDTEKRKSVSWLRLFMNVKAQDGRVSGIRFLARFSDAERPQLVREHPHANVDVLAIDLTGLLVERPDIQKILIPYNAFVTSDILKKEAITIGEEVLIIGYPLGLSHVRTNMPLVRQGIIATNIGEPIYLPIRMPNGQTPQGEIQYITTQVEIPAFLVDAAILPGSSGSPVVLKPIFGRKAGDELRPRLAPAYLLGIVSGMRIASIGMETSAFPALANLGIVYDATTILDTIELFFSDSTKP
jgi:S1-C subfamily serine protease